MEIKLDFLPFLSASKVLKTIVSADEKGTCPAYVNWL